MLINIVVSSLVKTSNLFLCIQKSYNKDLSVNTNYCIYFKIRNNFCEYKKCYFENMIFLHMSPYGHRIDEIQDRVVVPNFKFYSRDIQLNGFWVLIQIKIKDCKEDIKSRTRLSRKRKN